MSSLPNGTTNRLQGGDVLEEEELGHLEELRIAGSITFRQDARTDSISISSDELSPPQPAAVVSTMARSASDQTETQQQPPALPLPLPLHQDQKSRSVPTSPWNMSLHSTRMSAVEIESVTIPSDRVKTIEEDRHQHTVFTLEVRLLSGLRWFIEKRYSDFRELHEKLKRTSSSVKQFHFPKRHMFRSKSQSVIEQRRVEFEQYLRELLAVRPFLRIPIFNFLQVYSHMESYERKRMRRQKQEELERMKKLLSSADIEDLTIAFDRLSNGKTAISKSCFRRDILGVYPDMPTSFAMRFIKACADKQRNDISIDEFLRVVAILKNGSTDQQLSFVFQMCDHDHSGNVPNSGLTNFLLSLNGRSYVERVECRAVMNELFDSGRLRLSHTEFISAIKEQHEESLFVEWMKPFVQLLTQSADQRLMELQEEFNPIAQQKILCSETQFEVSEVVVLQDAFSTLHNADGTINMARLSDTFLLDLSEAMMKKLFTSFGTRANQTDLDIFSFVSVLDIACRGSDTDRARVAFHLFDSKSKGYLIRDDLFAMIQHDLSLKTTQIGDLIWEFIETQKKMPNRSTSTRAILNEHMATLSGSQVGLYVDHVMKLFSEDDNDSDKDKDKSHHDKSRQVNKTGHERVCADEKGENDKQNKSKNKSKSSKQELSFHQFLTFCCMDSRFQVGILDLMKRHVMVELGVRPNTVQEELEVALLCYTPFPSTPEYELIEDDAWYLIEAKWFEHWSAYVDFPFKFTLSQQSQQSQQPLKSAPSSFASKSPFSTKSNPNLDDEVDLSTDEKPKYITNMPLLKDKTVLRPKEEIVQNQHFVVICEDLWLALSKWYGGGPAIQRTVVVLSDGTYTLDIWCDAELQDADEETLDDATALMRRQSSSTTLRRIRGGGAAGLTNLGNTCYMNSALQCLAHSALLTEYFLCNIYYDDINRTSALGLQGKLAETYAKLVHDLWSMKSKSFSPRNFKKIIGKFNETFRGNDQQDSQEFLAFLLSGLSEDLNRIEEKPYINQPDSDGRYDQDLADEWWRNHLRREVSIIVALFTGQYKSLLTCCSCGFRSARFEPFTFLQVPLPEPTHHNVTIRIEFSIGWTPRSVSLRLPITATVLELKQALLDILRLDFQLEALELNDLRITEVNGSTSIAYKADARRLTQIRSIDRLTAYQLSSPIETRPLKSDKLVEVRSKSREEYMPATLLDSSVEYCTVQYCTGGEVEYGVSYGRVRDRTPRILDVVLFSRRLSYVPLYFKTPFRPLPFGSPYLERLSPECTTGLELYHRVWKRVSRFMKTSVFPELEEVDVNEPIFQNTNACGFVLRRVDQKGLTDPRSPWLERSYGGWIPCDNSPLDLIQDDAVAIDWNVEMMQNDFELDEMKRVEIHSSVANNEALDKGPVPLSHCLNSFTTEEKIQEGYCSACREHREMNKKLDIWRLSPIMVVHLKRFQYTQSYRRKLVSLVEFPLYGLDLDPFVAPYVDSMVEPYPVITRPDDEEEGKEDITELTNEAVEDDDASSGGGAAAAAKDGNGNGDGAVPPAVASVDAVTATTSTSSSSSSTVDATTTTTKKQTKVVVVESVEKQSTPSEGDKSSKSSNSDDADGNRPATRPRRGYTDTNLEGGRCMHTKYDLYGVVNHLGALGGGHYTAYCKNTIDGNWYYYDDERVRVIEESKVVTSNAYLLFYIRTDMDNMSISDLYPSHGSTKITQEDIYRFVEQGDERKCSVM